MKLLTQAQRERLLANGRNRDQDHAPVVKLFNPSGAGTWLLSELDPDDPDIAFGLCDLGFGDPELGSVRLSELAALRLPFGLTIERDLHVKLDKPMSVYAQAAREAGHIKV